MTKATAYALRFFLPLLVVLLAAGCDRPKVIPEARLKEIIKDTYLVNAYVQNYSNLSIKADSLDIYRPVLESHGYTVEDLRHTMDSYARRKSSRMSDIMREAVADLNRENEWLSNRVAVMDTVNARAVRMFSREIFRDSTIKVNAVKDTVRLRLMLPVQTGKYSVDYAYFVDSLDKNRGLRTTMVFLDSAGRRSRGNSSTNYLNPGRWLRHSTTVEAKDGDETLRILFGNYPVKDLQRPYITIDSLRVVYSPPLEVALDSLNRYISGNRFFFFSDSTKYENFQEVGGARRVFIPRIAEERGGNP